MISLLLLNLFPGDECVREYGGGQFPICLARTDAADTPASREMKYPDAESLGSMYFNCASLHLDFPFPAVSTPRKNIQDNLSAVENFQVR